MIYNLALIPCEELEGIQKVSKYLKDSFDSCYVLGENSYTHNTVLQFEANIDDANLLIDKLKSLQGKFIEIEAGGLHLKEDSNHVWFDVPVECSDVLIELQGQAFDLLDKPRVYNKLGLAYRPHFTFGYMPKTEKLPNFDERKQPFRTQKIKCKWGLGVSGKEFQFSKLLHIFA